ncbi:MAG: amidohydrolase family protein [Mycobacteriales bacterium]
MLPRGADGELPIGLQPRSSDEYAPLPQTPVVREAERRARAECEDNARRLGINRRDFLRTTCAAATTLLAINACTKDEHRAAPKPSPRPSPSASSAGGSASSSSPGVGGSYSIPPEATTEPTAAASAISGDEFVFDVQGHLLDRTLDPLALEEFDIIARNFPQRGCGEHEPRDCFSIEHFLDEMFVNSDTTMLVLSALPLPNEHDPLSPAVMAETRRLAGALCHDDRVLLHGKISPTTQPLARTLAGMEQLVATQPIVGWKTFTHLLGPGWWLDDHDKQAPQVADAVIRKAIELRVPRIAVHKGIVNAPFNTPEDVGPAAKRHPEMQFLIYHSAFDINGVEGPYTTATANRGSNRLITSLRASGITPNSNVYADIGTTWWQLMKKPTEAAHLLGKVLKYVGEDNVLWGTDSIWYGSPQDQIQAFRAFEISTEFQERYGYPALTKELKAKVLGLNGARVYGVDPVTAKCTFTRTDLDAARRLRTTSPAN